jgi:dipeptidyl aminopeptidase/acylaminoacyl peptidase
MSTPTPLGGRLVFVSSREDTNGNGFFDGDDNTYIVTLDLQTGEQQDVTEGDFHNTDPAWSPDGQQIAFTSSRGGNDDLYVMNSDGSAIRQLTATDETERLPSWSPDGTEIVYEFRRQDEGESIDETDLYIISVASGETRQLTNAPGDEENPDWSPDGRYIAYSHLTIRPEPDPSRKEIYLIDMTTGEEHILDEETSRSIDEDYIAPKWLPRQPLSLGIVGLSLSESALGAEPHFRVHIFDLISVDDRPTLESVGKIYKLYHAHAYTWGSNGEWYIMEYSPGLVAHHFVRQQRVYGYREVQLDDEIVLIDIPPRVDVTMPDWTP